METSEVADLDSLIDLLDEDFENENPDGTAAIGESSKAGLEDGDLDSLLDLMNEDDSKPKKDEAKNRRLDVNIDLFSSDAALKLNSPSVSQSAGPSLIHTGDTSEEEEDDKEILTETGQEIQKKIQPKPFYEKEKRNKIETWVNKTKVEAVANDKHGSLEKLIGIRVVKPLVSYDVMDKRLQGRKLVKMSFMKGCTNRGKIDGDWVTIGVLVRKIPPRTAKTGKPYSIWKLSDLHMTDKIVSLFLFGQVHTEHWKTAVGTVIGLLNPEITDGNFKESEDYATLKVDHPGKLMLIGSSKDFGFCKSKRKDGSQCTGLVNLSLCQFCTYHVKAEYKKFSQRSEIQSSWTGKSFDLRDKVLKGQNVFYGGQTFSPLGKIQKKSPSLSSKDKLTLSNLTLKRKAATVFQEEQSKSVEKIAKLYGEEVSKAAEKNSEFINNRLTIPSVGSRNLLQHMVKNKPPEEKKVCYVNPKDMLKQHALQMKQLMTPQSMKKDDSTILKNLVPTLGKGLNPGQSITFDFAPTNATPVTHYAKMRAIQKVKCNGPIQKKNPNAVKSNPEPKKIKAVLETSLEISPDNDKTEEKATLLRSKLGCIDLNSEKIKKILERKSNHAYEVEMAEMEKEAAYFDRLEKKEMMEEKMSSTKELVCDVVSCQQCKYTSHHAAERCKDEKHPLKCHKAVKRFFVCKDCNRRTESFSRFPRRSCRQCGGSRFERTGMIKARSGPKLDSEILMIRGEEMKFINR